MDASKLISDLVALRHRLHRRPELAGDEGETAASVAAWLVGCAPDELVEGLGGTGVAAVFEGRLSGPTLLVRADLDAVPVAEPPGLDWRSEHEGVAHKCGHDGHMAMLCGLASRLGQGRPRAGRVVLLFQPAEETGEGAHRVLEDPLFAPLTPDRVLAIHNLPGHALGEVVLREGTLACGSVALDARLQGSSSHAAYPEHGRSPARALARLLVELPRVGAELEGFSLATVVHAVLGERALGTSPGRAKIVCTLRAEEPETLHGLQTAATELSEALGLEEGLGVELGWAEPFPVTRSDPALCGLVRGAAEEAGLSVTELAEPLRWSEDFGHFTARWPGVLVGLGSGTTQPQLHHPDYDFPDALVPVGVDLLHRLVPRLLQP